MVLENGSARYSEHIHPGTQGELSIESIEPIEHGTHMVPWHLLFHPCRVLSTSEDKKIRGVQVLEELHAASALKEGKRWHRSSSLLTTSTP